MSSASEIRDGLIGSDREPTIVKVMAPGLTPSLRRFQVPRRAVDHLETNPTRLEESQISASELLPIVQRPPLRRRNHAPTALAPPLAAKAAENQLASATLMDSALRAEVSMGLQELEGPFLRLMENPALVDAWQHARRVFHTLQGTLATCGWLTWAIPAERAELECARAVLDPSVRNWETLAHCRVDADELSQALAKTDSAGEPEVEQPAPILEFARSPGRNGHILVVDDSRGMRQWEMRLFGEWGYGVTLAVDGLDALDKLKQLSVVDLILTDLEMPRLDGFQLLRQLREHPIWRSVPVIVISSLDRPEIRAETAALGASDFLTKPFAGTQLRQSLQHLLPPPIPPVQARSLPRRTEHRTVHRRP